MKKEYIVGVDFGYDVTSAWIVSLFDDNLYGESLKLNATNRESEKSYYSIIYYNPKYGYSLDDLSGNIIAGFKDKVSVLDQPQNAKKREAYTEYIKQIYARLLKYNTVLKVDKNGDANFYLCIAFPSKWNQEDKDAYIKFFNNALCEFGIEVIKEMNRLGMVIDCSHLGDKGFYDVIKYSTKPIVCSHSCSRTVCDHVRNMTDDMLFKLKENGGVVGINYCKSFITKDGSFASIKDVVKHIVYIRDLIGIDYIGLGSDFDGIGNSDIELKDASMMPLLIDELQLQGFSEEDIDKICYKNVLRVFKANF